MMGRRGTTGGPSMMGGRGPGMMQGCRMMGQRMMPPGGSCGASYGDRVVLDRLDAMDARMAKIETLLERLLQR